jgi:hypothetical protein
MNLQRDETAKKVLTFKQQNLKPFLEYIFSNENYFLV